MMKVKALLALTVLGYSNWGLANVISASPAVTDLIKAVGASEHVVGVDMSSRGKIANAKVLSYHRAFNVESLLSLNPSVIIGTEEMGPSHVIEQVKKAGVKVVVLPKQTQAKQILQSVDLVARALPSAPKLDSLKSQLASQIDSLASTKTAIKAKKKGMFLMSIDGKKISSAGKDTVVAELFNLAGVELTTAKQFSSFKPLTQESLVSSNPDLIVISKHTLSKFGSVEHFIDAIPALKYTAAGKAKAVHIIDGHSVMGGVNIGTLAEAQKLAKGVYAL